MNDMKPTGDRKKEAAKILKMMKDLESLAGFMKQSFPAAASMPTMQVTDNNSTASCPAGKIMKVVSGAGSELERSMCGKSSISLEQPSQVFHLSRVTKPKTKLN